MKKTLLGYAFLSVFFCFCFCFFLNYLLKLFFYFILQLDVIGIDEAQFFDDLYDFCSKAADHDGKTIILAGLDGDYLRYCLCTKKFFYD